MAKKILLLCVLGIVAIVGTSATDGSGEEVVSIPPTGANLTATQDPGADITATQDPGADITATQDPGADITIQTTEGSSTIQTTEGSSTIQTTEGSSTTPTTETSSTNSSIRPSTETVPATTKPPKPCDSSPCGAGSTCENRANQSFVCLCLPGDTYNNISESCEEAKVFPGQLTLTKQFDERMTDRTSEIFQTTSKEITDAIDAAFEVNPGYSKSTVLELRRVSGPQSGARIGWSVRNDVVEASVEMIFSAEATVEEDTVNELMKSATECSDCILTGSTYNSGDLCGSACDPGSMDCVASDGSFECSCKKGYFITDFSSRICSACPVGERFDDSKCVPCSFGYSGFNCQEDWKLILVIVGSVLGALLLIAIILLSVGATKSRKSSKKNKNIDYGKPYVSHSAPKAPLVNSSDDYVAPVNKSANGHVANARVPQIPRATTTSSWDRRTNLEMTPSNSKQNLVNGGRSKQLNDDQDDMFSYGQARPQGNPYATNNPYAQNRASINPYAQREGHSNPYFMPDDGSRYN